VLATAVDNVAAQALYERRGWKKDTAFWHYELQLAGGPDDLKAE
jgi:ribosomal protein S18 acetylase RimI-like enzyme